LRDIHARCSVGVAGTQAAGEEEKASFLIMMLSPVFCQWGWKALPSDSKPSCLPPPYYLISRRTQFRAARKSIPKSTVNNTNLKPIILLNQQYFFCTH
jgi:hypothetical protein